MTSNDANLYARSVDDADAFWLEQSGRIDWQTAPQRACDADQLPFVRWFGGGVTNLCYNAVDRHLETRADQVAIAWESTERETSRSYTYSELHAEVNTFAAVLRSLGVERGDRVIIYLPMVPEAIFAMLACARIGATHSVVFGGFAAASLAKRIDDARPRLLITADAGLRGGRTIRYKPLVDEALSLSRRAPDKVLVVNGGIDRDLPIKAGRDLDYATLAKELEHTEIPVEWLPAEHPSYLLYTSGTTGTPKGIQRDTGGHAVALATSMDLVFGGRPGEAMLTTSDIGWVVGHSYIVYGPLIHGMTSIVYEGLPVRPDPAIWWRLVEKYKVTTMFSSPTAIRVLKKQDERYLQQADTSSLRTLFLAGEPLDADTHRWIGDALGTTVIDNYWQTESGSPMLANCAGLQLAPTRAGSPAFPVPGYALEIVDEDWQPLGAGQKGRLVARLPTPPGFMSTIWGDDARFVKQYFRQRGDDWLYLTGDYALRDEDGYHFILGRDDDVINVAGHRLGTREIEEVLAGASGVAEAAVIGTRDDIKGQAVTAFVVPRDAAQDDDAQATALKAHVDAELGAIARPRDIYFTTALPKTRSGKVMRRALLALCEGEDLGDISTIEDPAAIDAVRAAMGQGGN